LYNNSPTGGDRLPHQAQLGNPGPIPLRKLTECTDNDATLVYFAIRLIRGDTDMRRASYAHALAPSDLWDSMRRHTVSSCDHCG
jgi:hypothetical protein